MRLCISLLLLAVAAHAAELPYFSVLSEDAGAWPLILSSIGLQRQPAGISRIFVARTGASASAEWPGRVERGAILILEGESSLADLFGPQQSAAGAQPGPVSPALSCKLSAVVVAVQSHDRVMQGLTHVAQSLRTLREHLGDPGGADSAESWRMLRDRQFRAFSMAEERALFARLVAREHESRREASRDPENPELIINDLGLFE
jgi:hypothetical protein